MKTSAAPSVGSPEAVASPAAAPLCGSVPGADPERRGIDISARAEPRPLRVLVVDDHPLTREGVAARLVRAGGIEVVGAAGEGLAALAMVQDLQPDVLVLERRLPDLSGLEVARRAHVAFPWLGILILAADDEGLRAQPLLRLGVRGLVRKSAPGERLVEAVRMVANGGIHMAATSASHHSPAGSLSFTRREREVLRLLALGRRNREIAESLVISLKTVEFHVGALLAKLDARSRTEVVLRAGERGLLPLDL